MEFEIDISYPDQVCTINFGSGKSYQYDAQSGQVVDISSSVETALTDATRQDDAGRVSAEIVATLNGYCLNAFGYKPEELIMMMYE